MIYRWENEFTAVQNVAQPPCVKEHHFGGPESYEAAVASESHSQKDGEKFQVISEISDQLFEIVYYYHMTDNRTDVLAIVRLTARKPAAWQLHQTVADSGQGKAYHYFEHFN